MAVREKVVFKVIAKCQSCTRKCKQEVNEVMWDGADVIHCPTNSQGFEKIGGKEKTTKAKKKK